MPSATRRPEGPNDAEPPETKAAAAPGRRGELVARRRGAEPQAPRVEQIDCGGPALGQHRAPGALERAWLEEHFDFHALDLEDVLSRNQRPKIDVYDDYLFIVLHLPSSTARRGGSARASSTSSSAPGYLVTIPNQPLQPVEYLFERCRAKEELREQLFSRGSGYLLYRLVDDSFDYCFPMLRKIGNKLDALEDDIFEGRSEEIVRDISNVKQEIINFRKVIRPQRPVLRDLEKVKSALPLHRLRPRDLLRRHRRRPRADLGHARELQGGDRGARGDQRVGDLAPPQRHPPRADLDQRRDPAADPDRQHLGDELEVPGQDNLAAFFIVLGGDARSSWSAWSPTSDGAAGYSLPAPWQIFGSGRPGASPT